MRHSFGVGVVDCLVRGILSEKRNQGDDGEENSLRILPCPSSGIGIFAQADLGCTISRKTELVDAHHDPHKNRVDVQGVARYTYIEK